MTDQTARRILTLVHQPNAGPGLFQPIIEEQGFELEIASWAMDLPPSRDIVDYDAVIILGGDMQVDQEHLLPWLAPEKAEIKRAIDAGMPILGICLGGQLIADVEGARVGPVRTVREGWNDVIAMPDAHEDPIMGRLPSQFRTIVWHFYEFQIPDSARPLAMSATSWQAFRLRDRPVWALQFHPEGDPDAMDTWVRPLLDKGGLSERRARYILDETLRHAETQRAHARAICAGFLAVVRDAHARRSLSHGESAESHPPARPFHESGDHV